MVEEFDCPAGYARKYRMIRREDLNTELRLLACFHSTHNIPSITNLIESSRGTRKKERLCVYAMHLMELSERSSTIWMVHKVRMNGLPFWNKAHEEQDKLVIAFEGYRQLTNVTVRPMTVISLLGMIHEDICMSAQQKHAAMIMLLFHKHQMLDGRMESLGHSFQSVNQRILRHAPCSVGILVDHGLGGTTQVSASDVSYRIVVPFFGGRDDCEALAYEIRMAKHPGIAVSVIKFVFSPGTFELAAKEENEDANDLADDEQILSSLALEENGSISCEENNVVSKEEITAALRSMNKSNLFIVGRMPLTAPILVTRTSDCPELGPVGGYLASVLVVQHYNPTAIRLPLVGEEQSSMGVHNLPDSPHAMDDSISHVV